MVRICSICYSLGLTPASMIPAFTWTIGPGIITATTDDSDTFCFVHFMLMFGKAF